MQGPTSDELRRRFLEGAVAFHYGYPPEPTNTYATMDKTKQAYHQQRQDAWMMGYQMEAAYSRFATEFTVEMEELELLKSGDVVEIVNHNKGKNLDWFWWWYKNYPIGSQVTVLKVDEYGDVAIQAGAGIDWLPRESVKKVI